jgi:hypothetical protein
MALDEPDKDGTVEVLGCSTKTYTPDWIVPLPCDELRPNGHPRTKLRKPSFAVCDWVETVLASRCSVKGYVPSSTCERIIVKMNEIRELNRNRTLD